MKLLLAADLHFGSVKRGLAQELAAAIAAESPDVTVIAGDLTLGARYSEFSEAGHWLQGLRKPVLVIPGNHDMPYWNLIRRFADPFHLYRLAASSETLMPVIKLNTGMVLGLNTAKSWQPHLHWQEGVARRRDIEAAGAALSTASPFKAVAAHHPFFKIEGQVRARPVRHAERAIEVFAAAGVEVVMSGHTHLSFAVEREIGRDKVIAIGAPTALSSRVRGESNGFWVVEAREDDIHCSLRLHSGSSFLEVSTRQFKRTKPRATLDGQS